MRGRNILQELSDDILDAASKGDIARMKRCLDKGANVNAKDNLGNTPLICAIETSNAPEACDFLIKHHADVNLQNKRRRFPLYNAAAKGDQAVCKLLLEAGANRNKKSRNGETAADVALRIADKRKLAEFINAWRPEVCLLVSFAIV